MNIPAPLSRTVNVEEESFDAIPSRRMETAALLLLFIVKIQSAGDVPSPGEAGFRLPPRPESIHQTVRTKSGRGLLHSKTLSRPRNPYCPIPVPDCP